MTYSILNGIVESNMRNESSVLQMRAKRRVALIGLQARKSISNLGVHTSSLRGKVGLEPPRVRTDPGGATLTAWAPEPLQFCIARNTRKATLPGIAPAKCCLPTRAGAAQTFLPDELAKSETGGDRSEVFRRMLAQANRKPREVVDFPANVPVCVALRYAQGKTISNQYGERIMFTLVDGRVMFLDPEVAGQIVAHGINVRENFTITRKCDGQKTSTISWEVARVAGEQPNGTLILTAAAPETAASGTNSTDAPQPQSHGALLVEANALIDVYAQILERTLKTYQGRIKPEEARSLLVTAYIQRGRFSSAA